jgi:hypothetical protein
VQTIAPEQLAQPLAVLEQAGHKFQTQANEVMKYIQDHRGELSRDVLASSTPTFYSSPMLSGWLRNSVVSLLNAVCRFSLGSAHCQRQAHASRARLH